MNQFATAIKDRRVRKRIEDDYASGVQMECLSMAMTISAIRASLPRLPPISAMVFSSLALAHSRARMRLGELPLNQVHLVEVLRHDLAPARTAAAAGEQSERDGDRA